MSKRTIKKGTRDGLGLSISKLAASDNRIFAFDCDLGRSTRSYSITETAPDRFIEMGIAEQDMISTAAGLASTGKVVFVNTFAVFLTGRAYDQIRQQVALPCTPVIICGSSAGLTQGFDGATHQSITDINLMRGLPNMEVYIPADLEQTEKVIEHVVNSGNPAYIRLSRFDTPQLIDDENIFEAGKLQKLKDGGRIALISSGPLAGMVLEAADMLREQEIDASVYNCHTIKPIDKVSVEKLADDFDMIFTIEEHSIIGGLGSAIAEVLAEKSGGKTARLKRLGVPDCFGESGSALDLLEKFGLDGKGICNSVLESL